jgi:hypothetical protein
VTLEIDTGSGSLPVHEWGSTDADAPGVLLAGAIGLAVGATVGVEVGEDVLAPHAELTRAATTTTARRAGRRR